MPKLRYSFSFHGRIDFRTHHDRTQRSAGDELAEDLSYKIQNFYASSEKDLKVERFPSTSRRKESRHSEEEKERERLEHEKRIQDTIEKVERALTSVFYDQ